MTHDPAEIRQRRERLGVSRPALSDWSGVKLRAITHIEEGAVAGAAESPSAARLFRALAELEANPHLLRGLDGDHPRHWMTVA